MTPTDITLVQSSWKQVLPIREQAAQLFYARLFELDPALKSLFPGDMQEQGRKLMMMIGTAVSGLDRPQELLPAVGALGRRHAGYGVIDRHYDTVAAALLDTLEKGLGSAFTPQVRQASAGVYGVLARTMQEAVRNS